jgi:hypothetical protein
MPDFMWRVPSGRHAKNSDFRFLIYSGRKLLWKACGSVPGKSNADSAFGSLASAAGA